VVPATKVASSPTTPESGGLSQDTCADWNLASATSGSTTTTACAPTSRIASRCSQPSAATLSATLESGGPERTDLVRNLADGKMTAAQIAQLQQDHDRGNERAEVDPLPLMV
jgi:hypothetical protein